MPIQKDPEGTEISHLEMAADFVGRHVLEIGCGDGRLTWRYAPSTNLTTGIDTDPEALLAAVAARPDILLQKISFVHASSLNLPFPPIKFDVAVLAWSL
jgi:ubiquinone/menaquinone biosynthesis C-methylase UbiE